MTKQHIEFVLSGYGVPFTDALADKLLEMFDEEAASYQHTINELNKALSENKGEWIPVSSVEEIPKEPIWVTKKGADYVELIGWDSQRNCRTEDGGFRCDNLDLEDVVAYMPYSEPKPYEHGGAGLEPYKAESEETE